MSNLASAAAAAIALGGPALIPTSSASAAVMVHRGFVGSHVGFVAPRVAVGHPFRRPFVGAGIAATYPAYGWGYPGYWGGTYWGTPAWSGAAWQPGWGVGWGRPVWRAGWGWGGYRPGWGFRGGWRRF